MYNQFRNFFIPPVFPGDELKTRRVALLDATLILLIGLDALISLVSIFGDRDWLLVLIDVSALAIFLVIRRWLRRGQVRGISEGLIALSLIGVMFVIIDMGSVRTPATVGYVLIIFMASLLLDRRGTAVTITVSSLAVAGLIWAEQVGLIRPLIDSVKSTYWFAYAAIFIATGGLGYWGLQSIRTALARAEQEIAARQATEAALRQSEAQLREAQHLAQLGSWELDLQTQTLIGSDEVYRIFGLTTEEVTHSPQAADRFLHPDDRGYFATQWARLLAGEQPLVIDHRIVRRDGRVRYVQERAQLQLDEHGRPSRVFGTLQDITERKQAELNFRTFFDTIDHLLLVLDDQGSILFANATVFNRLGYTPDELLGQQVWMLHPAEQQTQAAQIVASMLAGQIDHCPVPLQTKDGRQFPVETRIVRGEWNGQPALFGVTKDLSALQASEEKFATVFAASPALMALTDAETGHYVDVNEAFLNTLGYQREEVIGQTTLELGVFADLNQRSEALQSMQQQGHLRNFVAMVHTKSGQVRHGLFSAEYIQLQDRRLVLTMMNDITERQQTAAALEESHIQFQTLFEASPDAIVLIDPHDHWPIYDCNTAACQMNGYARHELIGQSIDILNITPGTPAERADYLEQIRQHGVVRLETFHRHRDGSLLSIEVSTSMIRFDGRDLVLGIDRDITKRKHAEAALQELNATLEQRVADRTAELQAANQRLTELDHLKDDFLSRISHELRTPLTSVKIYLELLETARPDKREKYLNTIKREADRLHVLIEDVLMFSQANAPADQLDLAPIDLNRLLETRLDAWRKITPKPTVTFSLHLTPQLPTIMLDSELLLQALTRLVTNALSYTNAGTVTVTTAQCVKAERSWLVLSVQDTGPGITPEDLPHIFERFYRGRAAADYRTPGTGVGLAICRELVTRLRGQLTVDTQVGIGSTFSIWLPAV
ncbi:MAG: PAS domain S-box protein [Anaerolineae bacterium]